MIQPWMESFQDSPDLALSRLLRGAAFLPGLARAAPSDALKALFSSSDSNTRMQLDRSLCRWLQERRDMSLVQRQKYILTRFISEYSEGLATLWYLELPESSQWLRENLFDLMHWARPLHISTVWNLPQQLALAGALTQQPNDNFRFFWLRLCSEAADPKRDFLLDPALIALARQKSNEKEKHKQMLLGLSHWAENLSENEDKRRFLLEWRSIKARFSKPSRYWRDRWKEILGGSRSKKEHLYFQWLIETDEALDKGFNVKSRSTVQVPPNISSIVQDFKRRARKELTTALIWEMEQLLRNLEDYAEQTDYSDFFVQSACNLGAAIVRKAPGHALKWARQVQRWSPNRKYAWDLRGRALYQLGRADLAEWVYWEAVRRLPGDATSRLQLARLLRERGALDEAIQLLQENLELNPENGPTRTELARLLAHNGQRSAAIDILRQISTSANDICTYTLGLILIAENRFPEAREVLKEYGQAFGVDSYTNTLDRLIKAGADGQRKELAHLSEEGFYFEEKGQTHITLETEEQRLMEEGLSKEEKTTPHLKAVSDSARADLMFRMKDLTHHEQAETIIEERLKQDDEDQFAWVVGALNRETLMNRLSQRADELPKALAVQLAVTGKETTAKKWDDLLETFPKKTHHLIALLRMVRSQDKDQATLDYVHKWLDHKPEDEDTYQTFLKNQARPFFEPKEGSDPDIHLVRLKTVLNDAIKQSVEVNDAVILQVA